MASQKPVLLHCGDDIKCKQRVNGAMSFRTDVAKGSRDVLILGLREQESIPNPAEQIRHCP